MKENNTPARQRRTLSIVLICPRMGPSIFFASTTLSLLLTTPAALASVTQTFEYDANGNRVSGNGLYFEYDEFNQLSRVRESNATGPTIEEYLYDDQGQRILKSEPQLNQTTYYLAREFIRVVNDSGTFDTVYYHDSKDLVARKDEGGTMSYYHPDHLGSTTLVTNNQGAIIEEVIYEPFGKVYSGDPERFAYTGQELDPGTGLQYYGARYYDPSLAQFTTPDSLLPDPYNPQALNRYAYVLNNPYKYTDPTGHVYSEGSVFLTGAILVSLVVSVQVIGIYVKSVQTEARMTRIDSAMQQAEANPGTASGEFNRVYAELLATQDQPNAWRYSPSGKEISYVERTLLPALREVRHSQDFATATQVLDYLLEQDGDLATDTAFISLQQRINAFEANNYPHLFTRPATIDAPSSSGGTIGHHSTPPDYQGGTCPAVTSCGCGITTTCL